MSDLTVFIDYQCPYVYRAAEWIHTLSGNGVELPAVRWRFFSLAQVNYRMRDGWQVWDAPKTNPDWQEEDYARGLRYFWAAAAAKRQGETQFDHMHLALVRAIHREKQELTTLEDFAGIAAQAGLDVARFSADFQDPTCLETLAEDHQAGVELKVFGTPTFVFPDARPAYLKLTRPLDEQEAHDFWRSFHTVVAAQPYVQEIKRPQP